MDVARSLQLRNIARRVGIACASFFGRMSSGSFFVFRNLLVLEAGILALASHIVVSRRPLPSVWNLRAFSLSSFHLRL